MEDAALLIFALCTSALDLGVTTFVLGHKMFMKRVRTFSFSERGGQRDILARSRPISVDVDPTPKCLALGLRTFSFSSNHLLLASWIEPCSWLARVGTIGVCRKKRDTTTWHLFFGKQLSCDKCGLKTNYHNPEFWSVKIRTVHHKHNRVRKIVQLQRHPVKHKSGYFCAFAKVFWNENCATTTCRCILPTSSKLILIFWGYYAAPRVE